MATIVLIASLGFFFLCAFILAKLFANSINERILLYRSQFTETADFALSDMFIFANPQALFLLNLVALVLVPAVVHFFFNTLIITGASFLITLFLPKVFYENLRQTRLLKIEGQLPDAFLMLSSSLQAGASLSMAIEGVVKQSQPPLSQEFGLLVARLRLGKSLDEALVELERRIPIPSFIMASSAIRISREVGGNLMETIDSMSGSLRQKKVMEGKIRSLTSQGRAQGIFMSALPILLAIVLSFLEPEAMQKLFTTPTGIAILGVMIVMQILGYIGIRKVTKIEV